MRSRSREQAPKTGKSAAADFGLMNFLTISTGEKIAAPLSLKAELRHPRKAQRLLSRTPIQINILD
jgi:putative transposase